MSQTSAYTCTDLTEMMNEAVKTVEEFKIIDSEKFQLRPEPNKWSCHEVCRHLILFNRLYLRAMNKAIRSGDLPTGENSFQPRWIYRKMIKTVEPPFKLKIKTLSPMYPEKLDEEPERILDLLIETEKGVIEILSRAEAESWDLDAIKGKNPVFKISMSLTEFIVYLDAHQRRHFWQIEQILKRLENN